MQILPLGTEGALENVFQQNLSTTFELRAAHFRRVSAGWAYPRHSHTDFELIYVVEGEQEVLLSNTRILQKPGDLLLYTPGESHVNRNAGAETLSYYCLHFDIDDPMMRQILCLSGTCHYRAGEPVTQALSGKIQRLIELVRQPSTFLLADRLESVSALCEFLAELARTLAVQLDNAQPLQLQVLQMTRQLADWITMQVELPETEQSIEALITKLGYSTAHGCALFSKVYGMSPRRYRSQMKLKRARMLLFDNNLSIQQVGEKLGYSDVAHFSRQFKRWTSLSPQAYRQQVSLANSISS